MFSLIETDSRVASTLHVLLTSRPVFVLVVVPHVTESILTWVCACADWLVIMDMTQEYVSTDAATAIAISSSVAISGLIPFLFSSLRSCIFFFSEQYVHVSMYI